MSHTRNKLGYRIGLVLMAAVFIVGLQPSLVSAAGSGYAASDVLGQLDGGGNPDFTANVSAVGASALSYPTGSALDVVHHRLFVGVDGSSYRVLVYNLDASNNLIDHTADYIIGQPDFTTDEYNVAQNGGTYQYVGILYEAETNRLYVSDPGSHRVLIYDLSGGITNGMDASYVLGQPDFTTNSPSTTTADTISGPEGLSIDSENHRLFVADAQNRRVIVFDLSGSITNGMDASYVLGQPDLLTSTANTTQDGMYYPEDVVYNSTTKQLFVADGRNGRVLVFDLSGGITNGMDASYVLGKPDFTTGDPGVIITTQSRIGYWAVGLGIDTIRNILYVDDTSSNRVLVYNLAGGISNGMNASMVLGQADFTTKVTATSQTGLNDPEGTISVDSANNRIYVTDSNNNRVLVYNFARSVNSGGSTTVGATLNSPFSLQLSTPASQGVVTYSLSGGSLPTGLSLNTSTGLISGTPMETGSSTFEITVSDDLGAIGTSPESSTSYTIIVQAASGTSGTPGAPNTGGTSVGISSKLFLPLIPIGIISLGFAVRRLVKD